jgi:hypothetical protein
MKIIPFAGLFVFLLTLGNPLLLNLNLSQNNVLNDTTRFTPEALLYGYITDTAGQPVSQLSVKAFWAADTSENAYTVTDDNGYYEIPPFIPFTAIEHIPQNSAINITYQQERYTIDIISQSVLKNGALYNLNGKKIASTTFYVIGENQYRTSFKAGQNGSVLLFSDGQHKAIRLYQHLMHNNLSVRYLAIEKSSAESESRNAQDIMVHVAHPDTLFYPIDTLLTGIDTAVGAQYDFVIMPKPVLFTFSVDISANDMDNGLALDSLQVEMYDLQGNLLGSANSLEDTISHLEITKPGHEQNVKFVLKRNNYVNSDTLDATIFENVNNEFSYELEKEKAVAYFWRAIRDPLSQTGTTAKIVVKNNEFNYNDTIDAQNLVAWRDTVPVNLTGNTEYIMKIIPEVIDGNIPLYTEEKTITLTPGSTSQGYDDLTALEQEQKLEGWVKITTQTPLKTTSLRSRGTSEKQSPETKHQLAGTYDIIIRDYSGNFIDSLRSTNGYYKTNASLPIAEEGTGFEGYIIVKPVSEANTHFGIYKLPITTKEMSIPDIANLAAEGDARYHGRPIVIPEKLTAFEDSTQTVNFMLTERVRNDPFSGQNLTVNPYHIQWMEGEGINSELMRYGVQNVYLNPNLNITEYNNFLDHIRALFDYPFLENRVSEPLPNTLIENYSLESDANRDRLGWNLRDGPNSTQLLTTVSEEGMGFNIGAIIDLNLSNYVGATREYVGRTLAINAFPSSVRESYMNSSVVPGFPSDLNIEDRVYTKMFIDHREEQVKGPLGQRVHNNLGYLRKVENFYNGQTIEEMYGSKE